MIKIVDLVVDDPQIKGDCTKGAVQWQPNFSCGRPPNKGGLHPLAMPSNCPSCCGRPPNKGGLHLERFKQLAEMCCGRPPNKGGLHLIGSLRLSIRRLWTTPK